MANYFLREAVTQVLCAEASPARALAECLQDTRNDINPMWVAIKRRESTAHKANEAASLPMYPRIVQYRTN